MSEWPSVRLDQLFEVDNSKLGPHDVEPTVLSLSKYAGLVRADSYFDKRIASEKLDSYKPVSLGGWAFSTIHIDEGSIALNSAEPGVISPMYTTMRWIGDPLAVPAYVALVVRQPVMLDEYKHRSQGSINRRRSLPYKSFAEIEIAIPSLDEQRRIVAVMAAVDAQIKELHGEVGSAGHVLNTVLSASLDELPDTVTYGSLATSRSGPSWAANEESKTPAANTTRVVKITNTKSAGSLDMSDETYVAGLPESTPILGESSLILVRTNGNRDRIGNVYRATPQVYGCAVSAFQFISQASAAFDRDYLYWALREPSMQKRMSDAASGSTGLGNLAIKWLSAAEIPWTANADERGAIVARLDAAEATVNALSAELVALRVVRADLLTSLLSQAVTVGRAVDQFGRWRRE